MTTAEWFDKNTPHFTYTAEEKRIIIMLLNDFHEYKSNQVSHEFDADFEEFWVIFLRKGTKKQALKYYQKVRRKVAKDYLHGKARAYIASVTDPMYQMYAEKFLNPTYERFNNIVGSVDAEVKQKGWEVA